jgi:hypothetical protein
MENMESPEEFPMHLSEETPEADALEQNVSATPEFSDTETMEDELPEEAAEADALDQLQELPPDDEQ